MARGVELASNRDAVGVINIGSAGGAAVDAAGILIASEVRFGAPRHAELHPTGPIVSRPP